MENEPLQPQAKIYCAIPWLLVDDLERTVAFYEQSLGFHKNFLWADKGLASVSRGGAIVNFALAGGKRSPSPEDRAAAPHPVDVSFHVEDLEALWREFESLSKAPFAPIEVDPTGVKMASLRDCNGYRLRFTQAHE